MANLMQFVAISNVTICFLLLWLLVPTRLQSKRPQPVELLLPEVPTTDLVWNTTQPAEAPMFGWEDPWMMEWKKKKYGSRGSCIYTASETPFSDGLLCEMPAYIPPRAAAKAPQKIPRVIFQSIQYRRVSVTQYIMLHSWASVNPSYEYILFDDDDMEDFICENFKNVSVPFSQIVAGASKADVWRVLVMILYGGVYMDGDLTAMNPLPISSQDNVVSGLGCWAEKDVGAFGVLEHWSMAFSPHHIVPTLTLKWILNHLSDPKMNGSNAHVATGPVPYARALHEALRASSCKVELCQPRENDISKYCNTSHFKQHIGQLTFLNQLNFNQTYANKAFKPHEDTENPFQKKHYHEEPHKDKEQLAYCSTTSRTKRKEAREQMWKQAVEKRKK